MQSEHEIVIMPDGTIHFIFYDELKSLLNIGKSKVKRASHVDPTPDGLHWYADLSPIEGPKLGPFDTRDEAISEEVKWIVKNHLGKMPTPRTEYRHVCSHCDAELEGAGDFPAGNWWWECPNHGRNYK